MSDYEQPPTERCLISLEPFDSTDDCEERVAHEVIDVLSPVESQITGELRRKPVEQTFPSRANAIFGLLEERIDIDVRAG